MIADTVQGSRVLTLITLGLRDFYSKKEIRDLAGLKGLKVRVQATPTEDALFSAYGAQVVHMPFGEVYTSLQTGVVDAAENGVNVYLSNKHSMSEHEANNNRIWVSDKAWNSLSDEEKKMGAGNNSTACGPSFRARRASAISARADRTPPRSDIQCRSRKSTELVRHRIPAGRVADPAGATVTVSRCRRAATWQDRFHLAFPPPAKPYSRAY